ncbi:putative ABC-type transport system involved in lysophospholipase L1 biosynthesis, ATPase component [gamma proteobacterium HIMB55]|nr:putative ABC-type transport system involved in lysophospholipase L1 biosynthesis, ATPase component [gamma proteobacterium HIMB55]
MIKTSQLNKSVKTAEADLEILRGIDLEIKRGETAAIVGTSGSGKSTLLGLLAGLDSPSGGDIYLDDTNIVQLDEDERAVLRSQKVGFVFQSFQLLPALTALENVMLPLELAGRDDARVMAEDYLARVGLGERLHHYPRTLSGGEQQRVAIARAFAAKPLILFADEPTGNLDTATGAKIIELLFGLNEEEGTTLVLVTHDNTLADRCQRKLVMTAGQLSETA